MRTEELKRAPGLLALYGRALIPKRGGGGDPVPEQRRVALRGVPVDGDHLRRYAEVCGFTRAATRLPGTYPHVVAFPLAMSLMTRRDFPFPLLGLVHIANRIEQHRPIGAGERLSYEVWTREPYPHAKGTAFDVVAEAGDGDGGLVWRSVSTYLRRERRTGRAPSPKPDANDADDGLPNSDLDLTWEVRAATGRAYASVSGDRNPIHLHPLTARLFGFPRAIAHGMWTKARCLAALEHEGALPEAYRVDVTFRAPVLLPARLRFRASGAEDGWAFELRGAAGSGREHLRGSLSPLGA